MNNIIKLLIENQNYMLPPFIQNRVSAEEYKYILEKPKLSNALLEKRINDNLLYKNIVPGIVISCMSTQTQHYFSFGYSDEEHKQPFTPDTPVDLASVTKIFTCIAIFILIEKNILLLDAPLRKYTNLFPYLKNVTLRQLLTFQVTLQTPLRINHSMTSDEAFTLINNLIVTPYQSTRPYSDMPAIVLGILIEQVTNMKFFDFIKTNILNPCSMDHTNIFPIGNTISYDYEYRIISDSLVTKRTPMGTVHDEKALILGQKNNNLCGHAGLFSTAKDMMNLASSLLNNQLINVKHLNQIGIGQTLSKNYSQYSQSLGYLCYSKHPIQEQSDVPLELSGNTFAISGYTGTYFLCDPLNHIAIFIATNRINHRLTQHPELPKDNTYTISFQKKQYISTKNYVYLKDTIICRPIVELMLQESTQLC